MFALLVLPKVTRRILNMNVDKETADFWGIKQESKESKEVKEENEDSQEAEEESFF